MDWIDENVAVGSLLDAEEVVILRKKDVDLIIDAWLCFTPHPTIEPIVENVMRFANLLGVLSEHGARTLIHCVWGVDRTPFLAMVYYAHKNECSYQDAYHYVELKHRSTKIHLGWVELSPPL